MPETCVRTFHVHGGGWGTAVGRCAFGRWEVVRPAALGAPPPAEQGHPVDHGPRSVARIVRPLPEVMAV